jgi:hypothetical protein
MTPTEITEDAGCASSCTSQSRCSVLDTLSPSDRCCIDAAAHAWINGGGDAEGVAWMWRTLQERVRELL